MMSKFIDPEFRIHQGCAQVAVLSLKHLADARILPFDVKDFAQAMYEAAKSIEKAGVRSKLISLYQNYGKL